ncbi:MarR family winged helix-turn-helix transcriptional regulator [Roseivivax sp. CAU 1761]
MDDLRHQAPGAPDGDSFLSDYLLFLLASTSAAASAGFHDTVRGAGLRVPEWRVLASLHDRDGQMITRLADLALMEQSRLTRIVEQMCARGLVERRSDARDRRRVRVFLTGDGAELAARMVEAARAHEAGLMARLPAGTGARLKRLLRAVHAELAGAPPTASD